MDKEIYPLMAELEDHHWWFIGRRAIIKKVLDKYMKPTMDTEILEIGSGTGGNLSLFSQYGNTTGIELDEEACRIAKDKGFGQIYQADVLSSPFPFFEKKQFDLIAFIDVLEHLDEDRKALSKMVGSLKKGGHLLITVPAFSFLWSDHDESHCHKRRYSIKQLRNLIEDSGAKLRYSTYYHFWFFPLIAIIRIIQSKFNLISGKKEVTMPNHFVNKLLAGIFSSEKYFMGRIRLPFGVSIIAWAQK